LTNENEKQMKVAKKKTSLHRHQNIRNPLFKARRSYMVFSTYDLEQLKASLDIDPQTEFSGETLSFSQWSF
ncbi:19379_t:CDS:2, partial [Gigaspora rosea]